MDFQRVPVLTTAMRSQCETLAAQKKKEEKKHIVKKLLIRQVSVEGKRR